MTSPKSSNDEHRCDLCCRQISDTAIIRECHLENCPEVRRCSEKLQQGTPRTDALLHERQHAERKSDVWDVEDVEAFLKHARQLERELADAQRELVELHAEWAQDLMDAASLPSATPAMPSDEAINTILLDLDLHCTHPVGALNLPVAEAMLRDWLAAPDNCNKEKT